MKRDRETNAGDSTLTKEERDTKKKTNLAANRGKQTCNKWLMTVRSQRKMGTCGNPNCSFSHDYSSMPKTVTLMRKKLDFFQKGNQATGPSSLVGYRIHDDYDHDEKLIM